jgi:hypothetical protein
MPVARPRGGDDRVHYVIVRRDGDDSDDEDDLEDVVQATKTAATRSPSLLPSPTSTSSLASFALPPGAEQANQASSNPTAVSKHFHSPRPSGGGGGGISQTTEHLLIAAGSIGATIIVVMILLAFRTMRKHGITFPEAVKRARYKFSRGGPPPPPPPKEGDWGTAVHSQDISSYPDAPRPSLARSGSASSQQPLIAPLRTNSLNRQPSSARASVPMPPVERSFLLDPAPPGRRPSNPSEVHTTSSTALPLQTHEGSATARDAESISSSTLGFPLPPKTQNMSPRPPPPTFRQFLNNRPSISAKQGLGPMVSRFSWTNSNAPQTPHDPSRDTNSHIAPTPGRDSFMTQRSSVPRFRTIDSWVGQQASRLEEQKLQEQLPVTRNSTYSEGPDMSNVPEESEVPDVPALPKNVAALQNGSARQPQPLRRSPSSGLPGKNIRHERHDTNTTNETAPIFRQHPGNEVRFSTRSLVPSEILNTKMRTSVL